MKLVKCWLCKQMVPFNGYWCDHLNTCPQNYFPVPALAEPNLPQNVDAEIGGEARESAQTVSSYSVSSRSFESGLDSRGGETL